MVPGFLHLCASLYSSGFLPSFGLLRRPGFLAFHGSLHGFGFLCGAGLAAVPWLAWLLWVSTERWLISYAFFDILHQLFYPLHGDDSGFLECIRWFFPVHWVDMFLLESGDVADLFSRVVDDFFAAGIDIN